MTTHINDRLSEFWTYYLTTGLLPDLHDVVTAIWTSGFWKHQISCQKSLSRIFALVIGCFATVDSSFCILLIHLRATLAKTSILRRNLFQAVSNGLEFVPSPPNLMLGRMAGA